MYLLYAVAEPCRLTYSVCKQDVTRTVHQAFLRDEVREYNCRQTDNEQTLALCGKPMQ